MIEAHKLRKTFNKGKVVAVDEVSFTARDGQITGLLGPNGAGKTTTLRMLYTLLKPDSGTMTVDGIDPLADPIGVKGKLGVVPDSRGLYDRLTARENIRYYGRLQGLAKNTIESRINHLSDILDMAGFIDRKTDGFSQGQRVKVAIARALIHEPGTILLDEPTNGLDVMTTRALRDFLLRLKMEGHCVVLSTHIMQEVAALCDRIVIISRGRIAADGTAQQLLEKSGEENLEDAFVKLIGSDEGLLA
ncbi:ATP-binding cassette domain-containing protein [Wenzhouxiangella sp. XN79A]|uniref:ABC transporter ATP-binding protein n=1 Tax=Wenzhouxiangella sp. XN79A TaxID=2724193 RepID=UPI00144A530D|nr:ATP-binding cassette domain-containing protein [Wenzhouxiangella sp. XN79A]NKI35430.1 ATP-binding cassette domain-containing protein [Wenzhouxiangella sp. XN79A]